MPEYHDDDALRNIITILKDENDSLKNGLVVSVADLQTGQVQQGIDIADHETRITTLETP